MLLQHSRRDARVVNDELVTLEDQDRSRWNRDAIGEGLLLVDRALSIGPVGQYQLQAAIAALHVQAATSADTDWVEIAALYGKLLEINPSPVIALNHAVAIAMSGSLEDGLRSIDELGRSGTLDQYYLFHAARADLLRRLHRTESAAAAYREAARLATNPVEVSFLHRRLQELN
jgi:RNA polymerase sigma-70 factor (ECF subfamily)